LKVLTYLTLSSFYNVKIPFSGGHLMGKKSSMQLCFKLLFVASNVNFTLFFYYFLNSNFSPVTFFLIL